MDGRVVVLSPSVLSIQAITGVTVALDHPSRWAINPKQSNLSEEQRALRRFTLAEGGVMLLLGTFALLFPLVAAIWLTRVVALLCLVAGLVNWITTLPRARHLSGSHAFWRFVVATLLVVLGIWMFTRLAGGPAAAASQVSGLALAFGVVFLVEGATASVVSLTNRHVRGWWWGLINGVVTLGIGLLILTLNAFALSRVLGTLVGISFIFSGIDILGFSASFHKVEGKRPMSADANQGKGR